MSYRDLFDLHGKVALVHGGGGAIGGEIALGLCDHGATVAVAAYAASKGGVTLLTRALGNEWCRSGINVNAIAPAFTETTAGAPSADWQEGPA